MKERVRTAGSTPAAAANCCSHVGQWCAGWLCSHFCIGLPFGVDVLDVFECAISRLWTCSMTSFKRNTVAVEELVFFTYLHKVL